MRELFNQTDIAANRQGKLSPAQVEFIKASVNPVVWIWGTVICFVLVILVYLLSDGFSGALGFLGWLMGAVLLFCLLRLATMWNLRRKLLSDPVTMAEGTITFKKLDALDMLRFSPETRDGVRLLPQGLSGLSVMLPPGDYRFYYLPTRKWLLSSEPLSSEAQLKINLAAVLGSVFGFDPDDLPNLRTQAASGEVLVVDGEPKFETFSSGTSESENLSHRTFADIGGVKFLVPGEAAFAFIHELQYRVYYYKRQPANFLSKIFSQDNGLYIAGIEPL